MASIINASTSSGLVVSPDTSGTIALQANGTTKATVSSTGFTAPTVIATTLSDGTNSTSTTNCIQGSAKAWVNYNAVSQTILASYNVSSVTYVSTGVFTINFTNALVDSQYSLIGTAWYPATAVGILGINSTTTTSAGITTLAPSSSTLGNYTYTNVAIFR